MKRFVRDNGLSLVLLVWFQSFHNSRSEVLAVLSIVLLSIFLRQDGSPESKNVGELDFPTGA